MPIVNVLVCWYLFGAHYLFSPNPGLVCISVLK